MVLLDGRRSQEALEPCSLWECVDEGFRRNVNDSEEGTVAGDRRRGGRCRDRPASRRSRAGRGIVEQTLDARRYGANVVELADRLGDRPPEPRESRPLPL